MPASGDTGRNLASIENELDRRVPGFEACGSVPGHSRRVKQLDLAYQRVNIDIFPVRRGVWVFLQVHQGRQTLIGDGFLCLTHGVDDEPSIGMVVRNAPGGIDAAEAHDHGKSGHWDSFASWISAEIILSYLSSAIAVASPPPMQSAAMPRLRSFLRMACANVTISRAPVEPIGWPCAQAPP